MKQHEASLRKTEEIKQLQREKEGLELDIDIIKQLKVKVNKLSFTLVPSSSSFFVHANPSFCYYFQPTSS